MCRDLRTHAIVISIICLAVTLIGIICETSFGYLIYMPILEPLCYPLSNPTLARGIQISIDAFWIVSEVLCLVGAIKNNKYLLIPFITCMCLTILGCVGMTILLILIAFLCQGFCSRKSGCNCLLELLPTIVPWLILLGLSRYFLVIVVKFYKELASGHVGGFQPGVDLLPYHSPKVSLGGGQAAHAAPAHAREHNE